MEEWQIIPSCPKYMASSLGRIKGLRGKLRKLVLRKEKAGRFYTRVRCDGKTHIRLVSRLVCEAFHGAPPSARHQVAHWDGNPQNNTSSNLRWATRSANRQDMKRHGTYFEFEKHPRAKSTNADVREIRCIYAEAKSKGRLRVKRGTLQQLAAKFDIEVNTIAAIVHNKIWRGLV